MSKFRKKPVVIDAWQYRDIEGRMPDWVYGDVRLHFMAAGHVLIDTLEGQMRADVGDWIVRGVKGELYLCKPDIFKQTYEPA